MDNSLELGTESIPRLLWKYSLPAVVGMVVQILYIMVDAAVVGHFVGQEGLAAVTLVLPITILSNGFGLLVGVGACVCTSLLLGQRRLADAEKTLGNAFVMLLISSAVMIVSLLFGGDLFIQQTSCNEERIREMARLFLYITISFGFLAPVTLGLNNIIRVQGNPHVAMYTLLIGALLNTILNPIFVGALGWGVAGSAWATVLSQTVTAVWVLLFFASRHSLLKLRFQNFRLDWEVCRPILLVGLAPFLTQVAGSVQGMVLMSQLAYYGDKPALAVWGIIYRTVTVVFLVVLGLYQGTQPILGYNYGARQFDRVRKTVNLSIFVATIWCVLITVPVLAFPNELVWMFTALTPDMEKIAPSAVRWSLAMMGFLGFQVISAHYFQAVGKPRLAIFLSLTRQVFFLIPLLLLLPTLLAYWKVDKLLGIWCSFTISDTLAFFLTYLFYHREMRQLKSGDVPVSILPPESEVEYASLPLNEGL
ncbi:MAG: MATE family efflux transporter [Planctomycetia bacterium]|nr:MATE family efflux transporter [Planctomycetia bacterium]